MNNSGFKSTNNAEGPDKVDMSLDDIIRLNKQQKLRKQRFGRRGVLAQGRRAGVPLHSGGGGGGGGRPTKMLRRRGQGVITGLAARKAALLKGVSPLNRPTANRTNLSKRGTNRAPVKRPAVTQRVQPFVQRRRSLAQAQRRPYTQPESQRSPARVPNRPFRLRRKWNAPRTNESQREARQATFLSRRGLKVHANVQKTFPAPQRVQRTRQWRTPLNSSGILTVSIENPGARTQPEPAHSWSLHPPAASPPAALTPPEAERKKPKGVALQFDINSVGKQTAMTLNERFRILKQKRVAAVAQQSAAGGRFVTVG